MAELLFVCLKRVFSCFFSKRMGFWGLNSFLFA